MLVQVNVMWLDAVTYLHHHGYEKKVPWYRGKVDAFLGFCLHIIHIPEQTQFTW